jgi:suppressor of fused protein SUFU
VRGGLALVTVGVCLRPQPAVEMAMQTAATHRRIELGIVVSDDNPIHFERAERYLSAQSNLPWTKHTWLGPGHTVPCDAFPGTGISAVLLQYEPPSGYNVTLPDFREDPVRLLWAVGITEQEREFALENGSNALISRKKGRRPE